MTRFYLPRRAVPIAALVLLPLAALAILRLRPNDTLDGATFVHPAP